MRKILLFLSFLLFTSCGYQPIFSSKNSNFLLEEIIYEKSDKISSKISKQLNYLGTSENYSKIIKVKLNSKKKIEISSKDSKGDPLIYKMKINTNVEIYSGGDIINKKKL